jgi:hypothetical protein
MAVLLVCSLSPVARVVLSEALREPLKPLAHRFAIATGARFIGVVLESFPGFDTHPTQKFVHHLEGHDAAEYHDADGLEGQNDNHYGILFVCAALPHITFTHAPGQRENRTQRSRELGVVKGTQQFDGGRLATLLAIMLQLDHAESQSADNDGGTEDLCKIGERAEIGHLLPQVDFPAPPGGLESPTHGLGR